MSPILADSQARLRAITHTSHTMLVEAGAGSGKTAVLAARLTYLLAQGVRPREIAAVTFTELAASELVTRLYRYVRALSLEDANADALKRTIFAGVCWPEHAQTHLASALHHLDELTCSTIHGFCQSLIKPYPVEADLDPMARVMDQDESERFFTRTFEDWLRTTSEEASDATLNAYLAAHFNDASSRLRDFAHILRRTPEVELICPDLAPSIQSFGHAVAALSERYRACGLEEPTLKGYLDAFEGLVTHTQAWHPSELALSFELLSAETPFLAQAGSPRKLTAKAWVDAYKDSPLAQGLTKKRCEELAKDLKEDMEADFESACRKWIELTQALSAFLQACLLKALAPVYARYQADKRRLGLLDFDDLITKARTLLHTHPRIRDALSTRYRYLLVDEFQDTDLAQVDIFWRLCGQAHSETTNTWEDFALRPGALFLVGDPKQAIYRFRGADVEAYLKAKSVLLAQEGCEVVSISVNFRSNAHLLDFVNTQFAPVFTREGQCGFEALSASPQRQHATESVFSLPFEVIDESSFGVRQAEAERVAQACLALLKTYTLKDGKSGHVRPLEPRDIALLSPSRTELWCYEHALEALNIPVSSQAGKNFFARQEVQDLIALSCLLSNTRDAFALGAFLRGPMIGLSDEEILDIVAALPRSPEKPESIPVLDLTVDVANVSHPLAREVLSTLQALAAKALSQTPYHTLSQAVARLKVRPLLRLRLQGLAERALANLNQFLELSKRYSAEGLAAFAQDMYRTWKQDEHTKEASPDRAINAVSLLSMHSAKGLEWPVVLLINTNTTPKTESRWVAKQEGRMVLHSTFLDIKGSDYELAQKREQAAQTFERERLWYVASTRACDLLLLPSLALSEASKLKPAETPWAKAALTPFPFPDISFTPYAPPPSPSAPDSYEDFLHAQAQLKAQAQSLTWHAPSRSESDTQDEDLLALQSFIEDEDNLDTLDLICPKGSALRGDLLHKLMEEVLREHLDISPDALRARAHTLMAQLGLSEHDDASVGLSSHELTQTVLRTLALPEIAALRPHLIPEVSVYGRTLTSQGEGITVGYVDALTLDAEGQVDTLIDWKSDVRPTQATLEHYIHQVRSYMALTGAKRGLIVLMSQGTLFPIAPLEAAPSSTPIFSPKGQMGLELDVVSKGQISLF